MQIEILDGRTLSDADARAIAELVVRIWPKPDVTVAMRQELAEKMLRQYEGPAEQRPRSFVVRQDGRVIAHAAFVTRTIGTSAGEMTIAGLARVCTDPDVRGQGLGPRVVRPIFDLVDQGVFPFSLFQTSQEVKPFYERLGCRMVENAIVNSLATEGEETCPFKDAVAMIYPAEGDWPEGEIDLRGPGY